MGWTKIELKCQSVRQDMTLQPQVKNNLAHVIRHDICNKSIELNFCVGCMVSQPNCMFHRLTIMSLINKIRNFEGYFRKVWGPRSSIINLKLPITGAVLLASYPYRWRHIRFKEKCHYFDPKAARWRRAHWQRCPQLPAAPHSRSDPPKM